MNDSPLDIWEFEDAPQHPTEPQYYHAPFFTDLMLCSACPIRPEAQRVVPGEGPHSAEIMILGRNPGAQEDACGRPFIHEAPGGEELDNWLSILGLARSRILITNSCHCHTRKDRPPSSKELMICTSLWLQKELEWFDKIQVIFTMGNDATKIVVGGDADSTGNLRPYKVTVKFSGTRMLTVFPLAHPGYLIRKRNLIPTMHSNVLPRVREMLIESHRDVYQRAMIR